jgi:hypothetical protein
MLLSLPRPDYERSPSVRVDPSSTAQRDPLNINSSAFTANFSNISYCMVSILNISYWTLSKNF